MTEEEKAAAEAARKAALQEALKKRQQSGAGARKHGPDVSAAAKAQAGRKGGKKLDKSDFDR